jgi:mono/diheme cytochrome c family protein
VRALGRTRLADVASIALTMLLASIIGCDGMPGKPSEADRPLRPDEITNFATLYATQCAGCHGADGRKGAARALNDASYLAVADDAVLESAIRNGIADSLMPGFGSAASNALTDEQVRIVVAGIRNWARPDQLTGADLPPYSAAAGDAARGESAYGEYCARCHGADGEGGPNGGSVVDDSYLALVSDQSLRTSVISGRTDLGMPDWRGYVAGKPMDHQAISDVVAWLASSRVQFPGRPYPEADGEPGKQGM